MEDLQAYRQRTAFMWEPLAGSGGFHAAAGVAEKVNEQGRFKRFCGDTVIFDLPKEMKAWLRGVQDELYARCGDCLSERLREESFHITLHDLRGGLTRLPEDVAACSRRVREILGKAQAQLPPVLTVRSCCAFSMMGTSIVMGFAPETEGDCTALMAMYEQLQDVVPLDYPLTLHATLAYYKPGAYDEETQQRLRAALECIGREQRAWTLRLSALQYAVFESMARFDPPKTSVLFACHGRIYRA